MNKEELKKEIEELREFIEHEFQERFLNYSDLKNVSNRYIQEKDFSEVMEGLIIKSKRVYFKGLEQGKKEAIEELKECFIDYSDGTKWTNKEILLIIEKLKEKND